MAEYSYDAFGNQLEGEEGWNPFKYCGIFGYREDEETALMKVGARYYDPFIGRWIQKDPILDGFNWWVYCDNDPVNGVDPSGEIMIPGDWLIAIGFVGLGLFIPPVNWAGISPSVVSIILGGIVEYHHGEDFEKILLELIGGIASWINIISGWGEEKHAPRAPFLPRPIFPPNPVSHPPF